MKLAEGIQYYRNLVNARESDFSKIFEEHNQRCIDAKLTFGGRSMYVYLRPNFITLKQYRYIQNIGKTFRNAVNKFKNAAISDKFYLDQVGLIPVERELVEIDPGYDRLSITSRWDSFMTEDELKYVELNAECPAGIAYSDVAAEIFDQLPFIQDFKKKYKVEKFAIRQKLYNELLLTWKSFNGEKRRKKPNIAIIDWREVPTFTEFQLFQEFFKSKGLNCIIADPRDLDYKNSTLKCGDFEIDLVYKRILTNDCVERPDETKNLVEAYRNKDICMINPFRAKIVHKKSIFAILTHEKNANLFTKSERDTINKHIPWTRMIVREKTNYHGMEIDLIDFISSNKDNFVIKPNDEYGGKGVLLGRETSQEQWNSTIQDALKGEWYVVQDLVTIPKQAFPTLVDGKLNWVDMVVDMDPYTFGLETEGVLTRLSSSSLANVTAGGGTTPTFVISPKVSLKAKSNKIKHKPKKVLKGRKLKTDSVSRNTKKK